MEEDSRYVHLVLEENILFATYPNNLHLTLPVAKEVVRSRLSFTDDKIYPVLVITAGVIKIDRAARQYLSSADALAGLSASALLVSTPVSSILGNFFLAMHKPPIPVKIFSKRSAAINWLRQFAE